MTDHRRSTEQHQHRASGPSRRWFVITIRSALLTACINAFGVDVMADEPATDPASDLTPARLIDDLESTGREKQARLNRIRLQLQKLADAQRSNPPAAAAVPPPEPVPHQEPPPVPQLDAHVAHPAPPQPDAHAVPVPPEEHGPEHHGNPAHKHDETHAPAEHDAGSEHVAPVDGPSAQATETLVGASIDRMALADSLFGNGQSDLALQAYSSIELLKQPVADRYWIEYQIANCHRRLGNLAEAEQRYRRLAGLVDAGWCAVHARWWLDALSTRAALQHDLDAIRTSLKTVENQLNAQSQQ
jgi:hypothetical protein